MADAKLSALAALSAPALDDLLYAVDVSDTTDDAAGSSRSLLVARLLGLAGFEAGGRLTTETGVGASTSDRTSQGTIYYTPHSSDLVRLYDGTRVRGYSFTERSLAVSISAGQVKDVFLYDNSGTLALEFSAAWTNATTRADALAWQSGLGWVKSGTPTRLWLGTVYGSGSNTVEDSAAKRFVWNAHNQVQRHLVATDATNTWNYTTGTWRQANANTANQVEYVTGDGSTAVECRVTASVFLQSSSGRVSIVGVGVDSTTSPSGLRQAGYINGGVAAYVAVNAAYVGQPGLGYHKLCWLEYGGDGTVTWIGDNGGDGQQTGITARLMG